MRLFPQTFFGRKIMKKGIVGDSFDLTLEL